MTLPNISVKLIPSRQDFSHIDSILGQPAFSEQVNSEDSCDPALISTLQAWKEGSDSRRRKGKKLGFKPLRQLQKGLN